MISPILVAIILAKIHLCYLISTNAGLYMVDSSFSMALPIFVINNFNFLPSRLSCHWYCSSSKVLFVCIMLSFIPHGYFITKINFLFHKIDFPLPVYHEQKVCASYKSWRCGVLNPLQNIFDG